MCGNLPNATMPASTFDHSALLSDWLQKVDHGLYVPQVRQLKNAVICGFSTLSPRPIHTKNAEYVVYDGQLKPVTMAGHFKSDYTGFIDNPFVSNRSDDIPMPVISGQAYYMGGFLKHYGHFILETLTRYWYAVAMQPQTDTQFVFSLWQQDAADVARFKEKIFSGYWREYLEVLGIYSHNTHFVTHPVQFENLVIPQAAVIISGADCFVSKEAVSVWRMVNARMSDRHGKRGPVRRLSRLFERSRGKKIYLSRRKVDVPAQGRRIVNEEEVESLFQRAGFSIVYPESLTSEFEKQYLLSNCKVLAAVPGSGLMSSVFIPPSANVLAISSDNMNKNNASLMQQVLIDSLAGHQTHIYFQQDLKEGDDHSSVIDIDRLAVFLKSI